MSCYFEQNKNTTIHIPKYVNSSTGVIYYDIKISIEKVEWFIERRYSDFAQLNQTLVDKGLIAKNLLPPKKIVGNKQREFLEQRRTQLEQYLQGLFVLFPLQLPRPLAEFLDFQKYDIIYLLQDLALLFHKNGDVLLSKKKEYNMSALEVYAISERLSLPCITENSELSNEYNFSNVLDFCAQMEILIVTPVKENVTIGNDYNSVDVPIGRSNIIPQNLCFNLNAFRNLHTLKFYGLSTENIADITVLKPTLKKIYVHHTTVTHIKQVLMCDNLCKDLVDGSRPAAFRIWQQLNELNLSGNLLTQIDESITMATQLRTLVLEQNRLRGIQHLAELPQLSSLSLAVNLISTCTDWHLELGNLVSLNLSQNRLKELMGLRKLLSLVNLDLSYNLIEDLEEIDYVAALPILESLRLNGNPLSGSVDYRPRVLSRFHERADDIILDNEHSTQNELDTVLVLSALLKSKQNVKQVNANELKL